LRLSHIPSVREKQQWFGNFAVIRLGIANSDESVATIAGRLWQRYMSRRCESSAQSSLR
jgi:hypothetical protein